MAKNNVYLNDIPLDSSGAIQSSRTLVYPHSKSKLSEYHDQYLCMAFPGLFPYGYINKAGCGILHIAKHIMLCPVYERFKYHRTFIFVVNNVYKRMMLGKFTKFQIKIPSYISDKMNDILADDGKKSSTKLLLRKIHRISENIPGSPFEKEISGSN